MKKAIKKKLLRIIRCMRVVCVFGLIDALKYIPFYIKIKKSEENLAKAKREINLKYDRSNLTIRANSTDMRLVESILIGELINGHWLGEYNQVEKFIERLPIKEPIIIDAGANIGLFSRLALKTRPDARVYAIEPEENNYRLLKKNTQSYAVKTYRGGIWSHDCKLEVLPSDAGDWGFCVREANQEDHAAINAISIGSLIDRYHLKRIDILKMDIEGSEYEVFHSDDLDWLKICQAIVIETHGDIVRGADVLVNGVLLERGFIKSVYGENQLFIKSK